MVSRDRDSVAEGDGFELVVPVNNFLTTFFCSGFRTQRLRVGTDWIFAADIRVPNLMPD